MTEPPTFSGIAAAIGVLCQMLQETRVEADAARSVAAALRDERDDLRAALREIHLSSAKHSRAWIIADRALRQERYRKPATAKAPRNGDAP